jgi:hypothetical protein
MIRCLLTVCLVVTAAFLHAQSFEVVGIQENYKGAIGEIIKVPIFLKNNSDKPTLIVIRKISAQLGSTQKNYFCIDDNCLDQRTEDYVLKVEAGQIHKTFHVAVEAGLAQGVSSVRYLVYNKANPGDSYEFDLNFLVEEKTEKAAIYTSNLIVLHDVYPNPVKDIAYAEYSLFSEQTKAKLVVHNILGNTMEDIDLPFSENKVKIRAENMNSGVYFYTLYIDNVGLITRKFIVKKSPE